MQVNKMPVRGESAVSSPMPEIASVPITRTGWCIAADLLRKLRGVNAVLPKHHDSLAFADAASVTFATIVTD
jgi:hypothetical protein